MIYIICSENAGLSDPLPRYPALSPSCLPHAIYNGPISRSPGHSNMSATSISIIFLALHSKLFIRRIGCRILNVEPADHGIRLAVNVAPGRLVLHWLLVV